MEVALPKKINWAVAGVLMAVVLGIYGIVYAPLGRQLAKESGRATKAAREVAEVRAVIASYSGNESASSRQLLAEDEATAAIHELSRAAQLQKVRFLSLSPGQPADAGGEYRIQNVDIEAESDFPALGEFLGNLETLPSGIFSVKAWDAFPDPKDPSKLRSKLNLALYLEGTEKKAPAPLSALKASQRPARKAKTETEWDSNPFVAQKNDAEPVFEGDLVLNGIAYDKEKPAAILNGKIVKVGDAVGPYTVTGIFPERVVVTDGTSSTEIRLAASA